MTIERRVVVVSGGVDSVVLLHQQVASVGPGDVVALTFDYGQRHNKEVAFARAAAERLGCEHLVVDLPSLRTSASALTSHDIDVPDGHYKDLTMRATVVPGRNMLFLAVAISIAQQRKIEKVYYGAHGGDHAIYPDCRPEFLSAMAAVALLSDYHQVVLLAPFMPYDKAAIVEAGAELGVDFSLTWSCYKGGERHCGTCGTCVERREAFELTGIYDPTEYEA